MTETPWAFDELFHGGPMVVVRTTVPSRRPELDSAMPQPDLHGNPGSRLMMTPNLHLPDIDGSEVLARLRADPALRDIPTYVLTADAMPGRREELLAAGASGYLTKPIDVRALQDVVARVAEEHGLERAQHPRPEPPAA